MNQFDEMFTRINQNPPDRELRVAILDLITECLEQFKDSLGYWEKEHIAEAISAFAWNLTSGSQPTNAWLRLSLVNAEKSLIPQGQRNEAYGRVDDLVNSLTYQQLSSDLSKLRELANQ
jgi:hypothetical protein